ncbi:cyclic-di-AMP-binding protein CbpB [Anaerococcus sp.]|uniref:cyclic-di-AMP-binding protein CbpB n=1 Tax=Anaerococcus sp. TaxID=1872515 RepID=UPI0027BAD32C|nr:cyclic-di-AMP-binding protein CbpB [Anaerococcus sp.]
MISNVIKDMFYRPTENLMVPAADVATCSEEDTLLHAVLVLSNSGYQIIPVLDGENHVRGLISISDIVTSFDDLSLFDEEKLNSIKVKEVMNQVVPILFDNYDLEDVLRLLVNNNFVCITHKNGYFLGIIPRKVALERFTHIAHNIDAEYDLVEKVNNLA